MHGEAREHPLRNKQTHITSETMIIKAVASLLHCWSSPYKESICLFLSDLHAV